jgi:hypothetical protein
MRGDLRTSLRKGDEGRGEKSTRERADERVPVNHWITSSTTEPSCAFQQADSGRSFVE